MEWLFRLWEISWFPIYRVIIFVARYSIDGWEFGCQNKFLEIVPAPECESLFSEATIIKLTCRLCIPKEL